MPSAAYDYGGNGYGSNGGYGQSNGFSGPREPPMNPYTMAALAAAAGPGRPMPLPVQAPLPIRITGQGPMVARPPPPRPNVDPQNRRFGIKIKIATIAVATFVVLSSAMFYRFIDTVTCSIWVGTGPCISAETGSPTMKGTTIAATLMFLIVLWTLRPL